MTNKETATMLKSIRGLFSVSYSPESIVALSKAIELIEQMPDEHGDLIDRDVLYMAVKSHNTSDAAIARNHNRVTSLQNLSTIRKGYIAEKHICLDDIIRAEAVIKAERKDDEQADC